MMIQSISIALKEPIYFLGTSQKEIKWSMKHFLKTIKVTTSKFLKHIRVERFEISKGTQQCRNNRATNSCGRSNATNYNG